MTDIAVQALEKAREAMGTWTCTFAPDFCHEDSVAQAQKRIMEGGTLWYIAIVTKQIDDALSHLSESRTPDQMLDGSAKPNPVYRDKRDSRSPSDANVVPSKES